MIKVKNTQTNQNLKDFGDMRNQRAKQILEQGEPSKIDEFTYLVPSQFNKEKKYKVTHIDSYSCECEDFKRRCLGRGLYCKHIKSILLFQKLKNAYEVEDTEVKREIELIVETPNKGLCPSCKSSNLIKRGVRKTKLGQKQRYSCKDCKKRFVLTPIPRIKGNAKLVCLAMDCYYRGLSYRDISQQFNDFYGLQISHITIRNWVLKFSETLEKYAKTIKPNIKGTWNADETLVRTKKGNRKRGADYEYQWNVMSKDTKFLLASNVTGHKRGKKEAQEVMTQAHEQNGKIPYQIITDRLPSYQDGIRKTFRNWGNERKVKHTSIVNKRHLVNNNNVVENLHTHQKEFQKVRRGINETQKYADGFKVFHNFVRKAVKDNQTPAERCGIGVNGNAWETMLLNSLEVPQLTGGQNMPISP